MRFDPPLIAATLIRRYHRFLADVRLASGAVVTVHCPNPGRMAGCCTPGSPVRFADSGNPKRKLRFTWELVHTGITWVGVNTLHIAGVRSCLTIYSWGHSWGQVLPYDTLHPVGGGW